MRGITSYDGSYSVFEVICAIMLISEVVGDATEDQLYRDLMTDYTKEVRPAPHYSIATNVTFGFLLHMIVDVDEKHQLMTTRVWLNINWMDTRLAWNRSRYNGIARMWLPHHMVWKPDIILSNNADPEYKEAMVSTDVFITNTGNITWLASSILRSSCQIRVRFYPFDDQECSLHFASWSYHGGEINLMIISEIGDLSEYMNNSEFTLLEQTLHRYNTRYSCCPQDDWPVVKANIKLRRRPLFYVFNHILPCVLISSMALLGFYIPPDTGEKVTMCITTMLSMGVYLKTITEIIPPTSEAVPLIGVYYVFSLFMVCMATVVNVWTLNLHNRGFSNRVEDVPDWIRKWVLGYIATMLWISVQTPDTAALLTLSSDDEVEKCKLQLPKKQRFSIRRSRRRPRERRPSPGLYGEVSTRLSLDVDLQREGGRQMLSAQESSPLKQEWSLKTSNASENCLRRKYSASPDAEESFLTVPQQTQTANKDQALFFSALKSEFEERFQNILKKVYKTLEQNEIRQAIQEQRSVIMWEWKQLAVIIDRLLLWLFIFATSLTTFFILLEPALFRTRKNP